MMVALARSSVIVGCYLHSICFHPHQPQPLDVVNFSSPFCCLVCSMTCGAQGCGAEMQSQQKLVIGVTKQLLPLA
jgi:hypothetical protein